MLCDMKAKVDIIDDEQFTMIVRNSFYYKDIIMKCGYKESLVNKQSLRNKIKNRIDKLGIDTSHFKYVYERDINEYLSNKYAVTSSNTFKKRLVSENKLKNICLECGLKGEWNGKKLILQLDHINGNNNDNSLSNLRLLCPNCHSQTDTFCRNK